MAHPRYSQHDTVKLLLRTSLTMIETSNVDDMVGSILRAATTLFDVEACSLATLDQCGDLNFMYSEGEGGTSRFRVPSTRGFAGWVAREGRPVLCNNPTEDPRFFGGIDRRTGFETKSIMCIPLMRGDEVIGVAQVLNKRWMDGFMPADLQLFEVFGELAAAAIGMREQFQRFETANSVFQAEAGHNYPLVGGKSRAMREMMDTAKVAAGSPATVLLMSENGTGKEVVARAIHRWSRRADGPFIAVNCVALTPELLASELFGHEKGAFTGATARKVGKFELADQGTIFLDEIGELTPDLQAKLLRVLQEREFQRVGGNKDIRTNVRILAATNRNLHQEVAKGSFREDLFYRLNVVTLTLPPLRDRREDIPELVAFFLDRYARELNRPAPQLTPAFEQALMDYDWPGNVRQLRNTIERAVVLARGPEITTDLLPAEMGAGPIREKPPVVDLHHRRKYDRSETLAEALEQCKKDMISRALAESGGNQARAAQQLGIQAPNLSRLIKKLGLK